MPALFPSGTPRRAILVCLALAFTRALPTPFDGLGAVGGGPHALTEHVLEEHVPLRAALLAGILARLA